MNNSTIWSALLKWMDGKAWGSTNIWEVVLTFLVVVIILLSVSLMAKELENNKLKNLYLKMKSEPHTMRNMFEELRIKIKRLNKKAKGMKSDSELVEEVANQVDKLYEQINRDSDFLAFIAEFDEFKQEVVPISKELEFVRKLIERYGIDASRYKIENKLNDDIKIPAMITQSMLENAFKYGDKSSPDFMTVTFEGPDNGKKYTIMVKNKVKDSFDSEVYSTKQGVKNLAERIANYNTLNDDDYSASAKKALKNGYYFFKIEFKPKSKSL